MPSKDKKTPEQEMEQRAEELRGQIRSILHVATIEEGNDGEGQFYVRIRFDNERQCMAHGGNHIEALVNAVTVTKVQHNSIYGTPE